MAAGFFTAVYVTRRNRRLSAPTPGLCGRCPGAVRVLSVGAASFTRHYADMAPDTRGTTTRISLGRKENRMTNYLSAFSIALSLASTCAAKAQVVTAPPVPANIKAPALDQAFRRGHGLGTQNHQCLSVHPASSVLLRSFQDAVCDLNRLLRSDHHFAPVTGSTPALRIAVPFERFSQTSRSSGSGTRRRSKKRIVAGAIAGGVAGFFGGGFLGAHIEGDRCDCDDPGVRGFLIGAPIGAAAGAIAGGKFVF